VHFTYLLSQTYVWQLILYIFKELTGIQLARKDCPPKYSLSCLQEHVVGTDDPLEIILFLKFKIHFNTFLPFICVFNCLI